MKYHSRGFIRKEYGLFPFFFLCDRTMTNFIQNSSAKSRFQMAIWTVKLAFLSLGIISTVLLFKFAVPYSLNVLNSTLPRLWFSFRSWLVPPYLYVVVNFIIIIIAVSSSLQQKLSDMNNDVVSEAENRSRQQKQSDFDSTDSSFDCTKTSSEIWPEIHELPPVSVNKSLVYVEKSVESSPATWSDVSCLTYSNEKENSNLSVSAHFAVRKATETHRKKGRSTAPSEKPSKPLGVAKPNQSDTLEITWKANTEERGKPVTRHLKKSNTWDVPPHVLVADSVPASSSTATTGRELRKSETFNDAASSASSGSASSRRSGSSGGGSGLRGEKVLSQDELNRRAEEFIEKFRLQRQASYKRERVNRRVH